MLDEGPKMDITWVQRVKEDLYPKPSLSSKPDPDPEVSAALCAREPQPVHEAVAVVSRCPTCRYRPRCCLRPTLLVPSELQRIPEVAAAAQAAASALRSPAAATSGRSRSPLRAHEPQPVPEVAASLRATESQPVPEVVAAASSAPVRVKPLAVIEVVAVLRAPDVETRTVSKLPLQVETTPQKVVRRALSDPTLSYLTVCLTYYSSCSHVCRRLSCRRRKSMASTELKRMPYERAIQWRNAALGIVDDFTGGTWGHDKCMVVLRGLPGCGKSTFGDILAREFREEFHFSANSDMNDRKVRVCSGALHQIQEGRDDPHAGSLFQQDVANSLRMSDVVIVDDLNVAMDACE
ncbi:hypothetical protein PHYSODRAFT_298160 [Phytophthora sojae]|uniref:AAA+ ATPase domain-containing protein n=1 Tax=Phytophthora sojae (strain P6497) TaxID=1094619 RepID=G4Z8V1_PHYSP|nr:hypothetical protein PHYSODRAFT_298160 [Phytophthora sojae]EGZ19722.1 hypothetical protein PHYSODRAFT_298160 [Phytophthora sojae]|eukprot:XP_009522439.1 hypothetical protein PHYSODRAFT_298160 [Phytophthora sojae]